MGNLCGSARNKGSVANNVNQDRARREQTWQATGTISLRDSKLKVGSRSDVNYKDLC